MSAPAQGVAKGGYSTSKAELRAMRDPLARITWEKWIAEGKARLIEDEA